MLQRAPEPHARARPLPRPCPRGRPWRTGPWWSAVAATAPPAQLFPSSQRCPSTPAFLPSFLPSLDGGQSLLHSFNPFPTPCFLSSDVLQPQLLLSLLSPSVVLMKRPCTYSGSEWCQQRQRGRRRWRGPPSNLRSGLRLSPLSSRPAAFSPSLSLSLGLSSPPTFAQSATAPFVRRVRPLARPPARSLEAASNACSSRAFSPLSPSLRQSEAAVHFRAPNVVLIRDRPSVCSDAQESCCRRRR